MRSTKKRQSDEQPRINPMRAAIVATGRPTQQQLQQRIVRHPSNDAIDFLVSQWDEVAKDNADLCILLSGKNGSTKGLPPLEVSPDTTAVLVVGEHTHEACETALLVEKLPLSTGLDEINGRIHALCRVGRMLRHVQNLDQLAQTNKHISADIVLEQENLKIVEALANAGESRDQTSADHPTRVGRLASLIAGSLGLDDDEVELIRHAATLHDLGKVSIPDSILQKNGPLTGAEFEKVKKHTVVGARMFSRCRTDFFRMVHDIALGHHENWDGSGYPHEMKGESIPVTARIAAVADVFDALMTRRPYKPAWPLNEAVAEIESLSGRKFDRHVVSAFSALARQELLSILYREDGSGSRSRGNYQG